MLAQSFRLLSLVFTALIMGSALCHVIEMPIKIAMAGADYMVVQQVYTSFGPLGAVLEPAAILSTAALAFLVRRRRSFFPALIGAVLLVAALLVWALVVNPVNPLWATAGPRTVPPDFDSLRARWEWGHVAHATLLFVGFLALVVSVVMDIPRRAVTVPARRPVAGRAA
jgi:hypothetical protein